MKNSFKTTFATALAVLTALSMTACKKTSNTEEMIVTENAVITDTVDVTETSHNIESVLKLQKPYVEKNTDIDLSKFTFDGVEYDFETMRYGDFLESTNTKPMNYPVINYDESNFKSELYGYARYKEEGGSQGTVYCMETELEGELQPIDRRYSQFPDGFGINDENKNDVKIHSFTVFETTGELDIILADGLLNYRTPTDKKEIIATLGEGTFVNDVDFLGYCDGKTVILFDLDSSGVRAERAIMYQLGEKPKASAETTVTTVEETTTAEMVFVNLPNGLVYAYDPEIDGVKICSYTGNEQKVIIPDVIEGKEVKSVGYCAFYPNENITEVVIPDSVTEIGDYAFFACGNLTKIELPDRLETIGMGAFAGVPLSSEMIFPDGLTSIGVQAFVECKNLEKVTIPDSVTDIGEGAFERCKKIVVTYKGKEYTYAEMKDLYKDINSNL